MPSLLLSHLGPSLLSPRGSCSHSLLTPAHEVRFSPLPRTSFIPRLCFAWSAFRSLRSQLALSFPSPLRSIFLSRLPGPVGNTSVSNFTTSSSFRIWKSIGHSHSSRSSQVFGLVLPSSPPWFSSCFSVTATPYPPSWHLTALSFGWHSTALSAPGWHPNATPSEGSTFGRYTKTRLGYARPLGRR